MTGTPAAENGDSPVGFSVAFLSAPLRGSLPLLHEVDIIVKRTMGGAGVLGRIVYNSVALDICSGWIAGTLRLKVKDRQRGRRDKDRVWLSLPRRRFGRHATRIPDVAAPKTGRVTIQ